MNIPIFFLWIYILYDGSSASAIEASKGTVARVNVDHNTLIIFPSSFCHHFCQQCRAAKELNVLCGEYTFQTVNPIPKYIDQLQKETGEINDMREKVQQLKVKETEVKLKDDLIASKDKHIQNLESTISDLRDTNRFLKQNVVELKTFMKEELDRKLSKIDSNASKLRLYEEQLQKNNLTIVQNAAQFKSKDAALKICESSLSEYKLQSQTQNKVIAENTSTISQLKAELNFNNQTQRESQKQLNESQVELSKQKEIIQQKDQEVSKLRGQIKEKEEIPTICSTNYNGICNVKILYSFNALCNSDIAGSGWIVIQQRINGGEDFYRNWLTYKNGFGNLTGDFFLGLEKIHRITNSTPHELYIYMEAFRPKTYQRKSFFARYDNFSIAGENDKYRLLSLGSYSGNADRDRMRYNEHQQFSTFDSDNDEYDGKCAVIFRAGWWFKDCSEVNLNGKYYQQEIFQENSNWWRGWNSLKTIKMMIRPRGN